MPQDPERGGGPGAGQDKPQPGAAKGGPNGKGTPQANEKAAPQSPAADGGAGQKHPGPGKGPGAGQGQAQAGPANSGPQAAGQNTAPKGPAAGGNAGQPRPGPGNGPGPRPGGPRPQPTVIETRPTAQPARMKGRHWGVLISLAVLVLLPLAAAVIYLWFIAEDQYVSTTGFTVRQEESGSATELLGGLAEFAGGPSSSDTDILYEFIQSQEIIEEIDERLDLVSLFSTAWPDDPLFALWPSASIEDLIWYWQRVVRVSYDSGSGLLELQVRAYAPDVAQRIAQEIVAESQKMINALNAQARADLMRYAQADLDEAVSRMKRARQALTQFRTRTQIVDPESDIQGQMGVINTLQQQLAAALIELDLLSDTANPSDPRVIQAQRRIEVIRERLGTERQAFARGEVAGIGADYPTLIAEYEGLIVDREYAEEAYRAALAALDIAREKASRQSRYLATYIRPTLAESSGYPNRPVLLGLVALFLFMAWGILILIYYSIRDRG